MKFTDSEIETIKDALIVALSVDTIDRLEDPTKVIVLLDRIDEENDLD